MENINFIDKNWEKILPQARNILMRRLHHENKGEIHPILPSEWEVSEIKAESFGKVYIMPFIAMYRENGTVEVLSYCEHELQLERYDPDNMWSYLGAWCTEKDQILG